jgi:hypothetical protein
MTGFDSMIEAVQSGVSIRRDAWEPTTIMFVEDGELMQQATGKPYPYQLSWYEINATDWRAVDSTSIRPQTSV